MGNPNDGSPSFLNWYSHSVSHPSFPSPYNVLVRAADLTMGTLTGGHGWINERKHIRLSRNPIGSAAYK